MTCITDEKVILEVNNLSTWFFTERGIVKAADGVSFSVSRGQTLCLVGESGCGKSVTARSLLGLIEPPGRVVSGKINLNGINILNEKKSRLEKIRGRDIAMVFQDPMASLNPVLSIELQLTETLLAHEKVSASEARNRALIELDRVGLPNPGRIMRSYPFELSGGMCQRVLLAMALMHKPKLLIVDEPTTALDTTVQIQILAELKGLQQELQMSLVLITHDMGVVAAMADDVAVMYAGSIMEYAPVDELFNNPAHPYTRALLNSIPRFGDNNLEPIKGQPPSLFNLQDTCPFLARCPEALHLCRKGKPGLKYVSQGHASACFLEKDINLLGASG